MTNSLLVQILALLKKEFLLEWRSKYALQSIGLYLISTVYIVYIGTQVRHLSLHPQIWNILFWIIMVFSSIHTLAKSFLMENESRQRYFYSVASPFAVILAKSIYHAGLQITICFLGFIVFGWIFGSPLQQLGLFATLLVLYSIGVSFLLTLVSAIAACTTHASGIMAILSIPLLIPILLISIKVSAQCIDGLDVSVSMDELVTLLALDGIVVSLSMLLFPFIRRG